MRIYLVSFTVKGAALEKRLADFFESSGHQVSAYAKYPSGDIKSLDGGLKFFTGKAFGQGDAVIFIGAAGIAVRAAAPFISSKDRDPAVIVIDDTGRYVVPVLSGHLGGANRLAGDIAGFIDAEAVITTSTDRNGVFSPDAWAEKNNYTVIETALIKDISSKLLKGRPVGFACDYPVEGRLPAGLETGFFRLGICVSPDICKKPFEKTLHIVPRDMVLGIGCRRDIEFDAVNEAVLKAGADKRRVAAVASVSLKAGEPALLKLAEELGVEFKTYPPVELMEAEGDFPASDFVKSVTGADNVCERAAAIASGGGKFLIRKTVFNGVTVAAAEINIKCVF